MLKAKLLSPQKQRRRRRGGDDRERASERQNGRRARAGRCLHSFSVLSVCPPSLPLPPPWPAVEWVVGPDVTLISLVSRSSRSHCPTSLTSFSGRAGLVGLPLSLSLLLRLCRHYQSPHPLIPPLLSSSATLNVSPPESLLLSHRRRRLFWRQPAAAEAGPARHSGVGRGPATETAETVEPALHGATAWRALPHSMVVTRHAGLRGERKKSGADGRTGERKRERRRRQRQRGSSRSTA